MDSLPLKERLRQVRLDAILEAAQELLAEKGYSAATMDDLAARVGVSKATLYQCYHTKEELALQVVLRHIQCLEEYIDALSPDLPPLTRLEQVADTMISSRLNRAKSLWRPGTYGLMPAILADEGFRKAQSRMVAKICALVREAQDAGEAHPDLEPAAVVQMLVSIMRDPGYESMVAEDPAAVDRLRATLVTVFIHGVRAKRRKH